MKSNIFRKVINEEYIEVNRSVPDTVRCLYEQSGGGRHVETPGGLKLYFDCTEKGKMYVRGAGSKSKTDIYQMYYVCGNVISKDEKTYVKITTFYKRSDTWLRALDTFLFVLLLGYTTYRNGVYNIFLLFVTAALLVVGVTDMIRTTAIRKKQKTEIITLMENEIKRRVKNIEKWDE